MKLLGVTGDRLPVDELVRNLQQAEPFLDGIILREKSKSDEQLIELVSRLADNGFPLDKLIMHARPHLASDLAVTKAQLTGYGMCLQEAQFKFPELAFGCSIHSLEEAKREELNGADWLLYGHVFETASKPGQLPRGTVELFEIARSCKIPVYAIGGIQPHHLTDLQRNFVAGAALLSPMRSPEALEGYRKVLEKGEDVIGKDD